MKRSLLLFLAFLALATILSIGANAQSIRPELAIIWVVDGISYQAPVSCITSDCSRD